MARLGRSTPIRALVLRRPVLLPPLPKVSTLTDTFDTQINPATWTANYGTYAWDASGRAAITEGNGSYSGIATGYNYDLTGSSIYVRTWLPAVMRTTTENMFSVYGPTTADLVAFVLYIDSAGYRKIQFRTKMAGVQDSTAVIDYDATEMAYLRIRMSGTTLYWDTSPDGLVWKNRLSRTTTSALTQVCVDLSTGQWAGEGAGNQSVGYWDNVNAIAPATRPKISTFIDDFSGASIDRTKWPRYIGTSIVSGQLQLPVLSDYSSFIESYGDFDLLNSSFYAKITVPPVGNSSREFGFSIYCPDYAHRIEFYWAQNDYLNIGCHDTSNFTDGADKVGIAEPWWKITSVGQTIYWHTSADGITWTQRSTHVTDLTLTTCALHFNTGYYGTESASYAYIDNVNITPGAAPTSGIWNGTSWRTDAEVWNGTSWRSDAEVWNGTSWQPI